MPHLQTHSSLRALHRAAPALLAAVLLAACAGPRHGSAAGSMAEDIEALERARFHAMARQDITALAPLLAEDLTYCHSNGECETKAQFLATIESGRIRYHTIAVERLAPRFVAGVWVVNGVITVDAEIGGTPAKLRLTFTDVHAPAPGGRWQLTAWHSARVP
jgi:hypothetical protein